MKNSVKNPPTREVCIKLARDQLKEILKTRNDIVSAYSDGSVARDDMILGSDIDICIVVKTPNEPWYVHRMVEEKYNVLIEWVFIPKKEYAINKILEDAGFTHDVVNAYIYYDPTGFFGNIQKKVLGRYKEKKLVLKRAENQLKAIEEYLGVIENAFKKKDKEPIHFAKKYSNIGNAIRHSIGFPCAILNRPVTHSRGFLFCEKACEDLGTPEYKDLVLDFLGSNNISKKDAIGILDNAKKIAKSRGFSPNESITFLYHLHTSKYLIDIGRWEGGVWPSFMWSSIMVNELRQRKGKDWENIKVWYETLSTLRWAEWKDIEYKLETGKKIIELGRTILNNIHYT